jgi:tRNA modification GTPase
VTNSDTIFAPASGPGPAAVAVVRISGPDAAAALREVTGGALPGPRLARVSRIREPGSGELLDRGLVLWLPGPASYSGEDMVELQLHGGRAVTARVLEALAGLPGLRPAEPGEFTRRAFANGKLDLTAAEGLNDLVNAETEAQRVQALNQMEGRLGRLYEGWREGLIAALAHLEAEIDFPDEGLPEGVAAAVLPYILGTKREISQHLDDNRRGERVRDGFYIAILGPPNVGKSSLLNTLAQRDAAIVSATAGTTRDVIEVHLDLGGYPVILADTAGLRAAAGEIEDEGVRRALARAGAADLKIALVEATTWPEIDSHTAVVIDRDTLMVVNKIDLRPLPPDLGGEAALPAGGPGGPARTMAVSVLTGEGLPGLLAGLETEVAARLRSRGPGTAPAPALTRARHRAALEECRAALERFADTASPELAAEDVRLAVRALGRITGRVDVEDLLDVIFRDFCIGK